MASKAGLPWNDRTRLARDASVGNVDRYVLIVALTVPPNTSPDSAQGRAARRALRAARAGQRLGRGIAVVGQEQLLQRRFPADQVADPGGGQRRQQRFDRPG